MIIDLSRDHSARPLRRPTRNGKIGIRYFDPSRERTARGSIERIVLHQWDAPVSLASKAKAARVWRESTGEEIGAKQIERWHRLAVRAIEAPYHYSVGIVDGEPLVIRAWRTSLCTQHAGTMNGPAIGIAVMGSWPLTLAEFAAMPARERRARGLPVSDDDERGLASALRVAIDLAVADAYPLRSVDSTGPLELLTHSQSASKPRDPGGWAIGALAPMLCAPSPVIRVDPLWSQSPGAPWTADWTRAAGL
jgi:hypothetical protein